MRFDELFEMRKLTGIKLKDYISGNGFTKVSFCKKAEISRPTLDKILNGEIDSKSSFDKHLNKIFTSLGIGPDTLIKLLFLALSPAYMERTCGSITWDSSTNIK